MANITVVIGLLLVLLGVVTFALTGYDHVTALIPAFFGLPLGVLGFLAHKDHLRKHVMHAAVLLGLIGCVGAVVTAAPKLGDLISKGEVIRDGKNRTASTVEQVVMAVLCGVFTGLCVKSFVDARRARKAGAVPESGEPTA